MNRKLLNLLVVLTTAALLLIGCGVSRNSDMGDNTNTDVNQDTEKNDEINNFDNTSKETNKLSMFTGEATGMDGAWETANGKSVVITFDEEKVRISSECSSPHYYAWFEYIDDPGATLEITLVDASEQTIQEMYDTVLDGSGSAWTKSELYEVDVNGMIFQCWDLYLFDKLERTEFAYETDNGYIVRNYNGYSEHTGTVSQVDLLKYVFINIESGGSTVVEYNKAE